MAEAGILLEDALRRPVDLVNCRTVSIVLQKAILAGGVCLLARDRYAEEQHELLALSLSGKLNEERREILADFASMRRAYSV